MSNRPISVVILAAGKGTRMCSDLPKVLHPLAGKALIQHVIDTALKLKPRCTHIIYGHAGELLKKALPDPRLNWVLQQKQQGTGHAVLQAAPYFSDDEDVLILYGDVPLISLETLERLLSAKPVAGICLLTAKLDDPCGYGRILRKKDELIGVIEHKDADEHQREINEINSGIFVATGGDLKRWLSMLNNDNAQGEFYITDIIAFACAENKKITAIHPVRVSEVEGVNNHLQLANLERIFQSEQATKLLLSGLKLCDPSRFDLRGELSYGRDITIDTNVIIEGCVSLGDRVWIGTGSVLKNSVIGNDCHIEPYSILENACLNSACRVGPFSRLRPGSELAEKAQVGNFVEIKNTQLGKGSKANHLSYLGDAEIGSGVNIGAGTITCNYDGANKHKTIIGDDVFIGSDSQLIAPVTLAYGVTVGAGTTVTDNAEAHELIFSRIKQRHIKQWQRPKKKLK